LVVRLFGGGSKSEPNSDPESDPRDPDPMQLVMAWDQEARERAASARAANKTKAAPQVVASTESKSSRSAKDSAPAMPAGSTTKSAPSGRVTSAQTKAAATTARGTATSTKAPTVAKETHKKATVGTAAATSRSRVAPAAEKTPSTRGRRSTASAPLFDQQLPMEVEEKIERRPTASISLAPSQTIVPTQPVADTGNGKNGNGNGNNGHGNGSGDSAGYTGDQIQILEGVQHIRQRPGMYIGTTSTSGLLHLVYEAIDNVVDEFNAGFGTKMEVTIDADGRATVKDEARGIPIDMKEWGGTALPTATWIFIKPFTGGKFEPGAYKQAGGLHGVGLTVINALAAELDVDIWRDGQHFHQRFEQGEAREYSIKNCKSELHGTQIRWMPDPTIFDDDATYDVETLFSRLEATACLNRGLKIEVTYWDEESKKNVHTVLHSQNGLADYVKNLTSASAPPLFRQPIAIAKSKDDVSAEVVLQPDKGYKSQILSFANGVRTPDGGTHEIGFKAALTKVVNDYALKWNLIKDRSKEALKPDIIQQGLAVVISVKLADPQFQGQTKNRLNNAPVEGIVRSVVIEGLTDWCETNQPQAKEWLKKIHMAQKARNEAQMAEELARTGQKKGSELIDVSLSKKFAACNGNDPERNELFLVEGDSAGGSAKQARKSEFQAILALRGKPLNVANASLQRILDNEEIRTIISVIGTGTRHVFDIERLKFHKVILLADADVDGSHIVCLLLTLFHQEMPGLIEDGHIYLGCPPLYSVKYKGKMLWLTDDEARKKFLREHPDAANQEFKRYKGLGEMNASELRDTTMDPAKRVLRRVTMDDSALASKIVNDLMARENAEARRALLARQAKHLAAGNLDV
jgi:DNA gyrase subunit B